MASFVLATPLSAVADAGEHVDLLRTALRAPAEFYRSRQQINGGAMILGPIQASRQHLEVARESLKRQEYGEALASTRAASMDCVVFNFGEDNRAGRRDLSTASSAEQEYKLGDPCKLRLVVKNATTLTRDPELIAGVKYQLQTVIRQFNLLDDMLERAQQGDGKAVEGVSQLLDDALALNTKFEESIKRCLGL